MRHSRHVEVGWGLPCRRRQRARHGHRYVLNQIEISVSVEPQVHRRLIDARVYGNCEVFGSGGVNTLLHRRVEVEPLVQPPCIGGRMISIPAFGSKL